MSFMKQFSSIDMDIPYRIFYIYLIYISLVNTGHNYFNFILKTSIIIVSMVMIMIYLNIYDYLNFLNIRFDGAEGVKSNW